MRVNQWIKKTWKQHLRCCGVVWVHDSSKMIFFPLRSIRSLQSPLCTCIFCVMAMKLFVVLQIIAIFLFILFFFFYSAPDVLLLLSFFSLLFQFREVNAYKYGKKNIQINSITIEIGVKVQLNKSRIDFEPNIDSPSIDRWDCCAFVNTSFSWTFSRNTFFFHLTHSSWIN